ncbi:hypothetical protein IFM89_032420 [Coptis chinensis]|uniref:Uncharacterized protein n=1 Tax=Coptis chinensis TaxID=261450 RepID=A0A835I2K1_9MAGN|nr:hypothetical protein IFM89_032420 [Coptis chinensis]
MHSQPAVPCFHTSIIMKGGNPKILLVGSTACIPVDQSLPGSFDHSKSNKNYDNGKAMMYMSKGVISSNCIGICQDCCLNRRRKNYGDAMLTRFLVVRLMNPMKAVKMLVSWKKWREEFVPLGFISDSEGPDELKAKKIYLQGPTPIQE